jgi:hypothetical protein
LELGGRLFWEGALGFLGSSFGFSSFLFSAVLLTGVLLGNTLDSGVLLYVTLGISYAVVITAFPIYNIYIVLLFRSLQHLKDQAAYQ